MKKKELKSLVNEMCKTLLAIIKEDDSNIKQVANFLQESAEIIKNVDKDKISTSGYTESLFNNAYEEIAKRSIESYKKTNKSIEELTKMHKITLSECEDTQLDLPTVTNKLNEIQSNMSSEVIRANNMIIEPTQQVKSLEAKTNLDALTRVFNRRTLTSHLDSVCASKKVPFSYHLFILDIDDFKKINDTHGYISGDKVLILYKNKSLKVTMSVEATRFIAGDTPDSLIARADKALYHAKKHGKNQLYTETINGI